MSTWKQAALILAIAATVPVASRPADLEGQQAPRMIARTGVRPTGWIGVTFEFDWQETWSAGAPAATPAMVITEVFAGSPAQREGLQVGDSILRINQRPVSYEEVTRLQASLQPGSEVSFQLRRDGRTRTVRMRADTRPADEELEILPPEIRYQVESAQALLLQHFDSATRAATVASNGRDGRTLVMFRMPGDSLILSVPGVSPMPAGGAFDGTWTFSFGVPTAPFEGVIARPSPPQVPSAPETRRTGVEQPVIRQVTLAAMQRQMDAAAQALATRDQHRRPLAPYLLGQDVIAGAKLAPVDPRLGDYFGVARGLLVVAVVEDTPAADAGVMPGDVIVASGRRGLATLEEMRAAFIARRGESSVPLTLVRKGRRLTVSVPR